MIATDKTLDNAPIDAALACLLDHLVCPALVVGGGGVLVHANRAARETGPDGLPLAEGRLRAANCRDQAKLDALLARLANPGASEQPIGPLALRPRGGGPPLLLQALPLPSPRSRDGGAPALALVLIMDPAIDRPVSAEWALGELGLTPREARVAARLGSGDSPQEIADEDEVSLSTVRFHVRNIYSKLDLCRTGQLSRMVNALSLIALGVGVGG